MAAELTPGDRYRAVIDRVGAAAIRVGRSPAEITMVVAAKTFGVDDVLSVIDAGARDIGENYVQEASRKRAAIGRGDVRWHFIGGLQRNKARRAVAEFDWIHTLDSLRLARALERAAAEQERQVRCLMEINIAGERSKAGVAPENAAELLAEIVALPHLRVEGLMAIPPAGESPEDSRSSFATLRGLRDQLARLRLAGVRLKELSMGMSGDFEIAVEEGATMVRIGTAVFGPRPKPR